MNEEKEKEFKRDAREVFDLKDSPVVSLPQFVIDRVKPVVESFEDGLTPDGALMCINGGKFKGEKLEDDPNVELPLDLPKLTPEFVQWRDDWLFHSTREMKLMLAIIYNYKLEETDD